MRRPSAQAGRGEGRDAAVLAGERVWGWRRPHLARWSSYPLPRTLRAGKPAHLPRDAAPDSSNAIQTGRRGPRPRLSRCICLRSSQHNGRPWMDKADIAALLALGAAFFIAIGDVIHQRSAQEVTDEPVSHVELFMRLLRDRPVVAGQRRLGRRIRAAGRGARLRFGAVGAGAAGHVAAVRAADQRVVDAPAGVALGTGRGRRCWPPRSRSS